MEKRKQLDHPAGTINKVKTEIMLSYLSGNPLMIHGRHGIGKSEIVYQVAEEIANKHEMHIAPWNKLSLEAKKELISGVPLKDSRFLKDVAAIKYPVYNYQKADRKLVKTIQNERAAFIAKQNERDIPIGETAFIFADVRSSQIDPTDLKGFPRFTDVHEYVTWMPDILFRLLSESHTKGFLFFDEFNHGAKSVQKACYQIMLDKAVGEISLSPDVYVLAAGNRVEDRTGIIDLDPALNNRLDHIQLDPPTIKEWSAWAETKGNIDYRIFLYLQHRPNALIGDLEDIFKKKTKAHPTPRSWKRASDALKALDVYSKNLSEDEKADQMVSVIGKCVGMGAAKEFIAFYRLQFDIKIEEIFAEPQKVNSLSVDKMWAVIAALVGRYQADSKCLKDVIEVCKAFYGSRDTFGVTLLRMIKRVDENKFYKLFPRCSNSKDLIRYHKDYFEILKTVKL